ncbi:MAG: heat-inducible transcriptional repressor HrcA [Eubacterium sp.]
MEVDSRKFKILQAIIKNYLDTGEPVGSRTISKYTDLNLSSATIRNEMADLEEAGYIVQPHTSAGRIPTDKGYRLYVDNMMKEKAQELDQREKKLEEKEDLLIEKVDKVETLIKNVAKLLANNTNYATMITTPQYKHNKIKFIQLSQVDVNKLLCVIVTQGNIIKNKIIEVHEDINNETVLKMNMLLNTSLAGLALEEINLAVISKLSVQASTENNIINEVLGAIVETVGADNDVEVYTSGATNIFKYPELSDKSRASELISTLEHKELLANLASNDENKENGIQVYIGNETPIQSMKDCSVVTATYELEDGVQGTIGIIGPKRMDYEKVVDTLKNVKTQLDSVYKKS